MQSRPPFSTSLMLGKLQLGEESTDLLRRYCSGANYAGRKLVAFVLPRF